MSESLPVFELEASGFTHVICRCTACDHETALTFAQMRAQVPALTWAMTVQELEAYLGCVQCGERTTVTTEKRTRVLRGGPRRWIAPRRA